MNKKLLFLILLISFGKIACAQDPYATWDRDFRKLSALDVIRFERHYADSVESDTTVEGYYSRLDSCKLTARYMGVKRKTDADVMASINRVNQIYYPGSNKLDQAFPNEYLFESDETKIWMPMDAELDAAFNKEIAKGARVYLYCLFLNEHTKDKKLFNSFLISEFRK